MKVLVTGGAGQFGYHVHARLKYHCGYEVQIAGRREFAEEAVLARLVSESDVIVHLAGVNRGTDAEVADGNISVASLLVSALQKSDRPRQVIYSSSIQRDQDNVYGQAKARVAELLASATAGMGVRFLEIVYPNLFGEFTRPNYNSFVGTFCHHIAGGQHPAILVDREVELLHYSDAADLIADSISSQKSGMMRPSGRRKTVGDVASLLKTLHEDYAVGIIPDLRDRLTLQLFNSYRSVVYPQMYPFFLDRKADNRGSLFECVKERNGGQVFYSSTKPNVTRGNHFHFDKVERFLVVAGRARIGIRKVFTTDVHHFDVSGDRPCFVDMPTMHTHNITNTGDGELLTMFWSHDIFDPSRPDTYMEQV